MRTIGFVKSPKENEHRIALLPEHLASIQHPEQIYIEEGYASDFGIPDEDYSRFGIKVVSRNEALTKDVICDPKIGDADYLKSLKNQVVFGWIHAVQNREITDILLNNHLTAFAWEDMFENGRHVFWRNNEIAGEAAIMHAYLRHGIFPYNTKVAILGRGNVARGAIKALNFLGADVTTYDRRTEKLFREELGQYDVVVNAILWDTSRKDHLIYKEDLKKMKRGAMIIDISCDRNGGIETSIPTTITNPDYLVDGIRHYVVDHTPSLFYKSASMDISKEVSKYIDYLINETETDLPILKDALIVENGKIKDERINAFQNRC